MPGCGVYTVSAPFSAFQQVPPAAARDAHGSGSPNVVVAAPGQRRAPGTRLPQELQEDGFLDRHRRRKWVTFIAQQDDDPTCLLGTSAQPA